MVLLNDDFLLTSEPAKRLFHDYAEGMPIIDYHCHLVPKDIYENKNYPNITRIWLNDGLYGDHYKWRLERANGVPEDLITGDGDEYEKFLAWVKTIEKAIGSPLYEWTHLELRRFFHYDKPLTEKNAKEVWDKANALLQTDDFKPRALIKRMNVKVVVTTDDPADDLHYHQLLRQEEATNGFKVLPGLRPDNLVRINQGDFGAYIKRLSTAADIQITDYESLEEALDKRFAYFAQLGGKLSDHGLNSYTYEQITEEEFNAIIQKAIRGGELSAHEVNGYQTLLMEMLMKLNKKYGWTMQYHMNVLRNANGPQFRKLGPDTGFDSMGSEPGIAGEIMKLFADAVEEDLIPKTILYSTNPNDWMELVTGMQSFQEAGVKQKMQLGCAWWFNDTREGMHEQLRIMAQQSLLGNFVGMLTDSRSFLSYPRHEYFRRVLCDLIGEWVVRGQVPEDYDYLGQMVQDICYNNAREYFQFDSQE